MGIKDIQNLKNLFNPAVSRNAITREVESYTQLTINDIDSGGAPTSNIGFITPGAPLESTQQIPIDFSNFENHTFFNSAESNVNVAFERIINHYPFDGEKDEKEVFLQGLTGFEKYVYDQFPKYKNFARFGGGALNVIPIEVKDYAGTDYPTLSKNKTGKSILNPDMKSITFEMQFYAPIESSHKGIILQKLSGSNGITLASSGSTSLTNQTITLYVSSASLGLSASMTIPKGEWSHIIATFDRKPGSQNLKLYKGAELQATSSTSNEFGKIDFSFSSMYIGTGSSHSSPGFSTYTPTQLLSGAIDELRIYHTTRSLLERQSAPTKNIFPSSDLKLYYKFNAPPGRYDGTTIVLDSSGNSLHGSIAAKVLAQSIRGISFGGSLIFDDVSNPMVLERPEDNPVLFPTFDSTIALNNTLLTSASRYDANNPNLITRLIPQHYLLEAAQAEGFKNEDANNGDPIYSTGDFPGNVKVPSVQIIASLLFMYGKFFDELKIYIDQFSKLNNIQYSTEDGIADTFLVTRAKQLGFDLPSQFTTANLAQFLLAQNMNTSPGLSTESLYAIQNKIWRRILMSLPEIIKSKGTRAAVDGILNTLGLEHQKVFRISEYGGRNKGDISTSISNKVIDLKFLDFSGSLAGSTSIDNSGFAIDKPVIRSTYLSSSRIEPGQPLPKGTLTQIGTNEAADGMLTSGSFTIEGIYKFPILLTGTHPVTQSLFRLCTTGTVGTGIVKPSVGFNVLAYKPNIKTGVTGTVFVYGSGASNISIDVPLSMSLQDVNLFDGNAWHITFGRDKQTSVSASYSLTARHVGVEASAFHRVSQIRGLNGPSLDIFSNRATTNVSGAFICVGSQSLETRSGPTWDAGILGDTFPTSSRGTEFSGKLSQLRFWSKYLTQDEIITHALNPQSLGVNDPNVNFCFGNKLSGSFERLRVAATMQQPLTSSDNLGNISLFDYSQSEVSGVLNTPLDEANVSRVVKFHLSGTGFESSSRVLKKEQIRITRFTSRFDVNLSDNKIQIETLDDPDVAETISSISVNDKDYLRPHKLENDNRFLIEVSTTQALNDDIMNIFGTLNTIENAIGAHQTTFSYEYPNMRHLREIYFNRLESNIKLTTFFNFFKFFDDTLSSLISSILPQNTNFLGVRFIVSPHILERGKYKHYGENVYLSEDQRVENNEFTNYNNNWETEI